MWAVYNKAELIIEMTIEIIDYCLLMGNVDYCLILNLS